MKNMITNTYIVEIEHNGISMFVKLYVTADTCYIERFHKGQQHIEMITIEEAKELTENTK